MKNGFLLLVILLPFTLGCANISVLTKEQIHDPAAFAAAQATAKKLPPVDPVCEKDAEKFYIDETTRVVFRGDEEITIIFPNAGEFVVNKDNVLPRNRFFLSKVDREIARGHTPLGWITQYYSQVWLGIFYGENFDENEKATSCKGVLLRKFREVD